MGDAVGASKKSPSFFSLKYTLLFRIIETWRNLSQNSGKVGQKEACEKLHWSFEMIRKKRLSKHFPASLSSNNEQILDKTKVRTPHAKMPRHLESKHAELLFNSSFKGRQRKASLIIDCQEKMQMLSAIPLLPDHLFIDELTWVGGQRSVNSWKNCRNQPALFTALFFCTTRINCQFSVLRQKRDTGSPSVL